MMQYRLLKAVIALALSWTIQLPSASLAADMPSQFGRTQIAQLRVNPKTDWVIVVHGGAGVRDRSDMTPDLEKAYRSALREALEAGGRAIEDGKGGVDAVEAAIRVLEDSELFNAGRGAALDEHGNARHDASIMRGDTRDAGAIAGSSRIRNPISAAKAVMEQTQNVLLHGDGADWFASNAGLEIAPPLYFQTDRRRQLLLNKKQKEKGKTSHYEDNITNFGTVGAVVRTPGGHVFAGTSTGGRTNKRFGRIGDSPIIGAGTYASDTSCAVSATGHGEYFMRWTVARDICARMEFAGESLEVAADSVLLQTLEPEGGSGAIISVDPQGKVVFSMTKGGMYRGVMSSSSSARTAIYTEDNLE